MNFTIPIVFYRIVVTLLCINSHVHIFDTHMYNETTILTEKSIFQEVHLVVQHSPILRWALKGDEYLHTCARDRGVFRILQTIHVSSSRTQTLLQLALLSGDIQPNPGPVKHPCVICERPVAKNHHALQCDSCDEWVHIRCEGITKEEYNRFQDISSLVFECLKCNLLTFTDSFFIVGGTDPQP